MRPVYQTTFGEEQGNCLQACVASIFEVALEDVPHFIKLADPEEEMQQFVKRYGLYWYCLAVDRHNNPREILRGYHLIEGISPRMLPHVVVGFQGETVHDPHPSGLGLSEVECYRILCAIDPAKLLPTR